MPAITPAEMADFSSADGDAIIARSTAATTDIVTPCQRHWPAASH